MVLISRAPALTPGSMRSKSWDRGKEDANPRLQHPDSLRRPILCRTQPLAAADEREHQQPAAPRLPEGHGPITVDLQRPRLRSTPTTQ